MPRTPETLWAISRSLFRKKQFFLARAIKSLNWAIHTCLLPSEAVVGRNLILEHYALGIVMHPQVTIGDNCRIYHQVTLAAESQIGSEYRVILEDDVIIGTHSVVIARHNRSLTIGTGAVLGAGAVLTKDIPPWEIWAGNPARKIKDRSPESVWRA